MKSEKRRQEIIDARRRAAGKNKRVRNIRRMLYVVLGVWGILGLIGAFTLVQWVAAAVMGTTERAYGQIKWKPLAAEDTENPKDTGAVEDFKDLGASGAGNPAQAKPRELTEEERAECLRLYQEKPELLVIANKERELAADYNPALRYICNGRLQAAAVMYDDLVALLHDAGDAGYDYWIASGYRSRQRQQELIDADVAEFMADGMSYEEALAKTLEETLPAGHSEHETGLSLDILCSGNTQMDASQAYEPGNRWLAEHCAEYGFILRYPADRENITGVSYEPWHFRYVGRDAAQFLAEKEITLEEFWENLP